MIRFYATKARVFVFFSKSIWFDFQKLSHSPLGPAFQKSLMRSSSSGHTWDFLKEPIIQAGHLKPLEKLPLFGRAEQQKSSCLMHEGNPSSQKATKTLNQRKKNKENKYDKQTMKIKKGRKGLNKFPLWF